MNELKDNFKSLLSEKISKFPGLAAAYLFGSMAKGTLTDRSDIDVALLFEDYKKEKMEKLSIMAELSGVVGRDVDVVILNEAEPRLYHEILRTGEVIVDKIKGYRILREKKNRKLYEDYSYLHKIYMKGMRAKYDR